jgi:hypothetical protein
MFTDQLRRAVEASPRANLSHVSSLLWKAYAAGQVSEAEAEALSNLIEARKAHPASPAPARRHGGSRPRSDASLERRRRWAASGAMPPQLQARFTQAESAVMAVVAAEARSKGACTLTVGHVAALAGVSATTVRNAMRQAVAVGAVKVEQRRLTAWRNAPNRVTVASAEWNAWIRLRRRGEGANSCSPRIQKDRKGLFERGSAKGAPTPETGYGGVRTTGRWKLCR